MRHLSGRTGNLLSAVLCMRMVLCDVLSDEWVGFFLGELSVFVDGLLNGLIMDF